MAPGGAEKPVFIRQVTRDEITSRCEICSGLAEWVTESRINGATAAYCREHIRMFLGDPDYDVPPELKDSRK